MVSLSVHTGCYLCGIFVKMESCCLCGFAELVINKRSENNRVFEVLEWTLIFYCSVVKETHYIVMTPFDIFLISKIKKIFELCHACYRNKISSTLSTSHLRSNGCIIHEYHLLWKSIYLTILVKNYIWQYFS